MSKARDIADLDFNSPDIDGGNIDGATIGATTAAVGSFTGVNISGGSQLGQEFAYFKSASTTNASLTLRKDSTGADAIDFLQLRNDGNGLIGKIEGDGDISFKDGNFTGSITATSATFTDDVAINNGSPELYFGTTGNHYNWRLAAQEGLDSAFEIGVGSQDTNYADDTYTPILVIKNNGTLGLGTTDINAWNASVFDGRLRIGARGVLATTTGSTQLGHNFYYDGAYKYIGADHATRYYQNAGEHVWLTAPNGSADATISFSNPRMVISNGGFVGIRESAPFAPLHIKETGWSSGAPYGTVQLIEGQAVNDHNWSHLVITDADDTNGNGGSISFATGPSTALNPFASIKGYREGSGYGGLNFYTRPSGGTATERMNISSGGALTVQGPVYVKDNRTVLDSDFGTWQGRYQTLVCHNTITANQTWTDVAYVSYSPSLTIQGTVIRDNNGSLGSLNYFGTVFGGYGAVTTTATTVVNQPMNSSGMNNLEYRYLNSSAPSGSYRLQVRMTISAGTMYVTTTLTGHAVDQISED